MIIKPKIRGFVCVTAHPDGCAAHVEQQIDYIKTQGPIKPGPKKVLVIGASNGYGLSSRITAAFGSGASTLGVFWGRGPEEDRPATMGWYNTIAFTRAARANGLYARNVIGDAFSDKTKRDVISAIKADLGEIDLVVYSLAAPRRVHPRTGVVHKNCIKPVGAPFSNKTIDTDRATIGNVTIEPATETEIRDVVAVMGGEDWKMWMDQLDDAKVLAPGALTVAYSYIGPQLTWPIYKQGTIGLAKDDLERVAREIDLRLKRNGPGRALVCINKALVTQASSAIPVVPLYISILYKIMKNKGLHEGCIEQIYRLYSDFLYAGSEMILDPEGRVRLDDWEMRPDVQQAVAEIWPKIATANLGELADFAGYRSDFLKIFGFGLNGVDYAAAVDPQWPML